MIEEREYGHLVLSTTLGTGVRVQGPAPEFTRMSLRLLLGWTAYTRWVGDECIMINEQVSYKIVGYQDMPPALVLELIHDYRPEDQRG